MLTLFIQALKAFLTNLAATITAVVVDTILRSARSANR